MIFKPTPLDGLIEIRAITIPDKRGSFQEAYKQSEFRANGIDVPFVQENRSISNKGVIRGLHYQRFPYSQGKLVYCAKGAIYDVAVDICPGSPTYGKWHGVELTEDLMLYIPPGFAHGFQALTDGAELVYKCTMEYEPDAESGILWNDPSLGIKWPLSNPIVSDKDSDYPLWAKN